MENGKGFTEANEFCEEQTLITLPNSNNVNTDVKLETEIAKLAEDLKVEYLHCLKISLSLEENENKKQGLFAPFSHDMKPDLEYIRLESELYTSNQEAARKLINDRYKWMMENAARRKVKEEKNKRMCPQSIYDVDPEDIKETTQSLHNLHIISDFLDKEESEELSDNLLEKIYCQIGLNTCIKCNYVDINAKTNIPSVHNLKTVTEHYELRAKMLQMHVMNELKDDGRIAYDQISQHLDSKNCVESTQISCDDFKSYNLPYASLTLEFLHDL